MSLRLFDARSAARDGDRCAFVGSEGRCKETAGLQYHHRIPFADGGPTTVDNLELRCAAHNAYEAERWFGSLFVRGDRRRMASAPKRHHESGARPDRSGSENLGQLVLTELRCAKA